jgi:predicted RNA-binding Zn-ribbon protein involved in translation (DUF1610 family)
MKKAKFHTECPKCGLDICVGDLIKTVDLKDEWVHAKCPEAGDEAWDRFTAESYVAGEGEGQ